MSPTSGQPTMFDVAALAGVSHQTVSRVLGDSDKVAPATRARVQDAIERLGYRRNAAARALARARTATIGVIVGELGLFGPSRAVLGVDAAARRAGFSTSLVALEDVTPRELARALAHLLDQAVEAIVVVAPSQEVVSKSARAASVPLVVIDGSRVGENLSVGVDQLAGGTLATAHLLALGHRRIAHVRGPIGWTQAEARLKGWRAVLRAEHASGPLVVGDWSAASGYAAGLGLAAQPDVTAVFVANDQMALGVLRALADRGRSVPGDMSVVGFDDLPESGFFGPPLTTVRQDFEALGSQAVDVAMAALSGEVVHPPLLVPELVLRASTAAR